MGLEKDLLLETNIDHFVWKHPVNEIIPSSQFTVYNNRFEVVILKDNEVLDVIKDENQVINPSLFKENNSIQVDVWYVKRYELFQMKWGTSSPVDIKDPVLDEIIPIRCYGECFFKIVDTEKFLLKLLGKVSFNKQDLSIYFRSIFMSHFKQCIATYLNNNMIRVSNIFQHVDDLKEYMIEMMNPIFILYGVKCKDLKILEISYEKDKKIIVEDKPKEVKPIKEKSKVYLQQDPQFVCPKCHLLIQGKVNYCPNCGHKMSE